MTMKYESSHAYNRTTHRWLFFVITLSTVGQISCKSFWKTEYNKKIIERLVVITGIQFAIGVTKENILPEKGILTDLYSDFTTILSIDLAQDSVFAILSENHQHLKIIDFSFLLNVGIRSLLFRQVKQSPTLQELRFPIMFVTKNLSKQVNLGGLKSHRFS